MAARLHDAGMTPNVQCYTALVAAAARDRDAQAAIALFHAMEANGVAPDVQARRFLRTW
jgi:pentatricopeptide repeat protein